MEAVDPAPLKPDPALPRPDLAGTAMATHVRRRRDGPSGSVAVRRRWRGGRGGGQLRAVEDHSAAGLLRQRGSPW